MLLVMGPFAEYPQQIQDNHTEESLERCISDVLPEVHFTLPDGTATTAPLGYAVNYNHKNVSRCASDILLFPLLTRDSKTPKHTCQQRISSRS